MDNVTREILLHAMVWFLLLGSIAGLGMGALLISRPDRLRALSNILNRWISTRHLEAPLERSVSLDPWFYRHRHISAGVIQLGAIYMLYFFTVSLDAQSAINAISGKFAIPDAAAAWLLDAMVLASLTGAVLAFYVSMFLMLRPSALREFEQGANRWISLRQAMKPVEIVRGEVDEFVYKHARRAGILLIVGSMYVLALLATWISQ